MSSNNLAWFEEMTRKCSSRVDVGMPPENFGGWTTVNVCFHGFSNLPTTRDEVIKSPEFKCLGHQWKLILYPGGRADSDEGHIAVMLSNRTDKSVKTQYGLSVRGVYGEEVVHHKPQTNEFGAYGSGSNAVCFANFAKRSTLTELLVQGSLVIEVQMDLPSTGNKSITKFIPSNPINKNVLELFEDEETADVIFEIGEQQQAKGKRKRAKKSTTTFYAHRPILQKCARTLYELCGGSVGDGITTVSITDVTPDIFKHMLHYTYGGKLSDEDLKANTKDIIDACDKYGVVHLKLEAEATYVKSTEITIDNVMDNLLYADSKNLALLKEAVMDFIVANKGDIMGKVSFSNVPGDTVTDILAAVARGEETVDEEDSTDYNKMRVGTLRKMLDEKGMDVDGSRESMIALIKEHSKRVYPR